jgi:hypothetical protein
LALEKSNLAIPFSTSLDLKTDPFQVMPTSMLRLVNCVYTKDKRIEKRNGYASVTALPSGANATTLTTFNGNLTAIGTNLYSFSTGSGQWINHGRFQPVQLSVQSIYRSAYTQSSVDSAVADSGLVCSVFLDGDGQAKYVINDSATGTQVVPAASLPATATNARVFVLPSHFVITFLATVSAATHFQYIAVPLGNLTNPTAATDLSTAVATSLSTPHDGVVANNTLYLAWGGPDIGGSIKLTYLTDTLVQSNTVTFTGQTPAVMSVCADNTGNVSNIWVSFYQTSGTTLYAMCVTSSLTTVLGITSISAANALNQITSTAQDGVCTIFTQVTNTYNFSSTRSDYINSITCTSAGVVGTLTTRLRSVGLASKAFLYDGTNYMLVAYGGAFQPSYFLIDGSGNIVAKLAYQNGGGYITTVLPSALMSGSSVNIAYQFKDLVESVNKEQGAASVAGVYSQTGVNLATFDLASTNLITAEIGRNLHIAGGYLWMFDGTTTCEHGFHIYPEDILATPSSSGGSMLAQQYYYQVVYSWTDAQGNIHRSAPSIPVSAVVGSGTMGSVVLKVPTLRLTGKPTVKITIFRWSAAQQSYYQITSVSSPTLNSTTVDNITFTDTQADSAIIGNSLIYTTGGVVENIAAPACSSLALYKSRLMVLNSEDPNSVWYSKQVIEGTPADMSDLFTLYVAPTTGAQGSTGPSKVLSAMDDKFIVSKDNAFYYFVGVGPDNTGNNNDFSDPVYVASTVGTDSQHSVALIPQGLMFRSDKGIWLLGRDLSTQYIGARVEDYNDDPIVDAQVIPGTNQVRLCLESGNALLYDYFFDRWGTFSNIPAISATLWQGYHTYLTAEGSIRQETPGMYLDAGTPVLMSWTSSWLNLAGLQGFQRAYMLYILGSYASPHKLRVDISYDYAPGIVQRVIIEPTNYSSPYGSAPPNYYGQGGPYGGPGTLEQWRIFLSQQKCQSFQVSVTELYDSTLGVAAGAGLTFSGMNLVVGMKKGWTPLPAAQSVG